MPPAKIMAPLKTEAEIGVFAASPDSDRDESSAFGEESEFKGAQTEIYLSSAGDEGGLLPFLE